MSQRNTPTKTGNRNRAGLSQKSGDGLATAVYRGGLQTRQTRGGRELASEGCGSLNPGWIEWLMGWPVGASDWKPSETARFRQWLQQHGGFCEVDFADS